MEPLRWDIFCRVIDNYGDIGVCWRLAADLAVRGQAVRLWVDDPSALDWMAPADARQAVQVIPWRQGEAAPHDPGDVVVEAFGCDPPEPFVARMAALARPPVWINLEYLSAEDYVERCHRLPSPVGSGPGRGLVKHFFYPGFTPRTGGLLREPGLLERRAAFDRDAWLASHGWARRADEQVVVLFCYPDPPALAPLLVALAARPTLLLATPGAAARAAAVSPLPAGMRAIELPWLTQPQFDELLWSADLNLVRGEDSFVRAQWAGAPFVWQIYPQHDGVHADKLDAFLARFLAGQAPAPWHAQLRALWRAWNGLAAGPGPGAGPAAAALPPAGPWHQACAAWRDHLAAQPDLASQLVGFVAETR